MSALVPCVNIVHNMYYSRNTNITVNIRSVFGFSTFTTFCATDCTRCPCRRARKTVPKYFRRTNFCSGPERGRYVMLPETTDASRDNIIIIIIVISIVRRARIVTLTFTNAFTRSTARTLLHTPTREYDISICVCVRAVDSQWSCYGKHNNYLI